MNLNVIGPAVRQGFYMNNGNQMGSDSARAFYREVMKLLEQYNVPFLVGGAFALERYTGIRRDTKDFDIFLMQQDCLRALSLLSRAGYKTELTDKIWIGKVFQEESYVDFIFGSANSVAVVDPAWFEYSVPSEVLDLPVLLCPPEEVIWSKAFVMERDRFDGADINHIFHKCAELLDWQRLIDRFGQNWRVLLMHLISYGFVYPSDRQTIPDWVMFQLISRLTAEIGTAGSDDKICQGPLLALKQYNVDIDEWGYRDARKDLLKKPEQYQQGTLGGNKDEAA